MYVVLASNLKAAHTKRQHKTETGKLKLVLVKNNKCEMSRKPAKYWILLLLFSQNIQCALVPSSLSFSSSPQLLPVGWC